jgi:uncharacterized protein
MQLDVPTSYRHGAARSPGVALITGGTRGIGRAIAEEFASKGHDLVLVARDAKQLSAAKDEIMRDHGVSVVSIVADVSDKNSVYQMLEECNAANIYPRFLVNNAASWSSLPVEAVAFEQMADMIATNVIGPVQLIKALLPGIRKQRGGILNVGSLAGALPTPGFACYGATKAFVASMSVALRHELRGAGINVCLLLPGAVDTEFVHGLKRTRTTRLLSSRPDTVAHMAYRALMSGHAIAVPGAIAGPLYFGIKVLPEAITWRLLSLTSDFINWRQGRSYQ